MTNHFNTFYEILDCAHSLVVAGGYNGFSYADIAEFVGIRKASIHHHFPTKVDLVRTLVRRYREEAETGIGEIERHCPAPEGQLRAYMGYGQSCIGDVTKTYCVCALLASQIPVLPQEVVVEVRTHFRVLSAWLTSVLERGSQQGSFKLCGDARSEAEAFMATVHGAMLSARAYGDPEMFSVITLPLVDRFLIKP